MKEYLKNICGEYAQNHNFSGVCMLKRKGETVFSEAYGYASRPFHVPNNVDTRFDTASITKIFTAAAVLQLVQEGKLRLTDKIVNMSFLNISETTRKAEKSYSGFFFKKKNTHL